MGCPPVLEQFVQRFGHDAVLVERHRSTDTAHRDPDSLTGWICLTLDEDGIAELDEERDDLIPGIRAAVRQDNLVVAVGGLVEPVHKPLDRARQSGKASRVTCMCMSQIVRKQWR